MDCTELDSPLHLIEWLEKVESGTPITLVNSELRSCAQQAPVAVI